MKVLAVGDIHTKLWIIMGVEDFIDHYDAVVFVGDYADDWKATAWDSVYTWGALMELQSRYPDKIKCVVGNHDYIYVNKTRTLQSGYMGTTQLLINMPENKRIREWVESLPIRVDIDGVTYTHAGITNSFELPIVDDPNLLWHDDSPLWARPPYARYDAEAPQVFGHTPSETCWEVQPNVWCIDTFSTHPDGTPIGDRTMLEIIDGKEFSKIKMEEKNDNNSTNSIERRLS